MSPGTILRTIAAVLMQAFGSSGAENKDSDVTDAEIFEAVKADDFKTIKKYLLQPFNATKLIDREGKLLSPLHHACELGKHKCVEYFIRFNVNVDIQSSEGLSPIYAASQNGHYQVVKLLIQAQADVNLQLSTGESSLYIASQNGHEQVVKLLIEAQADVDLHRNTRELPLYIASQNQHRRVLDVLIKAQADVDLQEYQGCSPLYYASQNGSLEIVMSLINAHANVNLPENTGSSPLYIASQNGHHKITESLIKAQADVNMQEFDGCSPLYIASECGHHKVVELLIKALADVNLQEVDGGSPLFIASQNGHELVANSLIKAQADVNIRQNQGKSPIYIASQNGHRKVMELLIKAGATDNYQSSCEYLTRDTSSRQSHHQVLTNLKDSHVRRSFQAEERAATSDPELSRQLHSALTESGFVDSRAALQSAAADVLQEILGNFDELFVVGSYSEGWSNSLTALDGRTDIESDIDVMELYPGRLYHPRGLCDCEGDPELHELSNGHIQSEGYASNPADPTPGSTVRPALDIVSAVRLCRYSPIAPLQKHRACNSNIPQSVLQALQRDLTSDSSPCHVVHAASPGRGGHELRVSTSFLEKRMLRSLSTLQGQLFVTLKYLVKKVICHKDGFKEQGLKSYHVKTITFRMVEETPVEQWKPENLVSLTRRSLQMLLDCVESSRTPDNAHGRIMQHFFMSDASLYLKGSGQNDQSTDQTLSSIANTLRTVIDELPRWLLQFKSSLRSVSDSGLFYFHPFLILSHLTQQRAVSKSSSLEYHEIYDVVRESLLRLSHISHTDCSPQSKESLVQLITRLPDCALTAREALRALACLKLGNRSTARRIVSECRGHSVSRGIAWSAERSAAEATTESVWRHLRSHDSAWKFCFEFEQRELQQQLKLPLPAHVSEFFPLEEFQGSNYFYMNFDAALWALRLELKTGSDLRVEDWIRDVAKGEDADEQEKETANLYKQKRW